MGIGHWAWGIGHWLDVISIPVALLDMIEETAVPSPNFGY